MRNIEMDNQRIKLQMVRLLASVSLHPSLCLSLTHTLSVSFSPLFPLQWDLAGPERFVTVSRAYYRNCRGALLMYDISNRDSFESIKRRWFQELKQHAPETLLAVLVGCKSDLPDGPGIADEHTTERERVRQVSFEEGERLASELGLLFFMECSSKSGEHVEEIVMRLSAALLRQNKTLAIAPHRTPVTVAAPPAPVEGQSSCALL
jgi:GTPase SAR1 family protein